MIVVNFSHPLTDEQRVQIEALAGQPIDRVIDVPTHFAEDEAFAPQAAALVDSVGLTPEEWQTLPLLVNLPSYAPIAAVILAYLHGLSGHFPTVLRFRPISTGLMTQFDLTELVSLDRVRAGARQER